MHKLFNIENEIITTKYAITYHDIPFMTMEGWFLASADSFLPAPKT
jgi:hypothetical protein